MLLLPITACIFGVFWIVRPEINTVSDPEIGLADISQIDWQRACFAPAYHVLMSTNADLGTSPCWNGQEVPEHWTYLTFYSQNGICERYRFQADFLVPHGADYRCFPRHENEDIRITIENGVLSLR